MSDCHRFAASGCAHASFLAFQRRNEPALDFRPRGLGLLSSDQTARFIAVDAPLKGGVDHGSTLAGEGVPGALWLPDTGFGALDPVTEGYLFEHLERATGGDRARDVVFYCRMDCWMSWNAAKRALAAGYENVHWFRDGIDDWRFEGFATQALRPAPGERLPSTGPD